MGLGSILTAAQHEAEQIVADGIVERIDEILVVRRLPCVDFAAEFLVFAVEQFVAAQEIDGAVLGDGHEPRAGIARMPDSGHCSRAATDAS